MVKLFLNLIFILIVFATCYIGEIYLFFRAPQPGETAFLAFRYQSSFAFDQDRAFKGLRTAAIAQYTPIYVYVPNRVASTKSKMEGFISEVLAIRSQGKTGRGALVGYLKKEFGVDISPEMAGRFLKYPDLKNLLAGILTIQESISQTKIVEEPEPLKGKMTARVLYPDPVGISAFPANEIITLEKARLGLRERVHELFWQVDPKILNPVVQISLAMLQPNLKYDQQENDRGIKEIIKRYPSNVITYKPDTVIVPFLKVLNEKDVLLLTASQEAARKDLYSSAPWVLFIICFSVLLYNLLLSKVYPPGCADGTSL